MAVGSGVQVQAIGRRVLTTLNGMLALTAAAALGFDQRAVTLLLPSIDAGLWTATTKLADDGGDCCGTENEEGL
ncbi:MAG: hypothetical protein WCK65_13580 [Rhodospirillaceae bacterium]